MSLYGYFLMCAAGCRIFPRGWGWKDGGGDGLVRKHSKRNTNVDKRNQTVNTQNSNKYTTLLGGFV